MSGAHSAAMEMAVKKGYLLTWKSVCFMSKEVAEG